MNYLMDRLALNNFTITAYFCSSVRVLDWCSAVCKVTWVARYSSRMTSPGSSYTPPYGMSLNFLECLVKGCIWSPYRFWPCLSFSLLNRALKISSKDCIPLLSVYSFHVHLAFVSTESDIEYTIQIPDLKVIKKLFGSNSSDNGKIDCEIMET